MLYLFGRGSGPENCLTLPFPGTARGQFERSLKREIDRFRQRATERGAGCVKIGRSGNSGDVSPCDRLSLLSSPFELLAGAPALAATPGGRYPGRAGPYHARRWHLLTGHRGGGGKLGGFFPAPSSAPCSCSRPGDQVKDMTPGPAARAACAGEEEFQKVMAMSDGERAKLKADMQAKWEALPAGQKARIQQRLARGFGGPSAPAPRAIIHGDADEMKPAPVLARVFFHRGSHVRHTAPPCSAEFPRSSRSCW